MSYSRMHRALQKSDSRSIADGVGRSQSPSNGPPPAAPKRNPASRASSSVGTSSKQQRSPHNFTRSSSAPLFSPHTARKGPVWKPGGTSLAAGVKGARNISEAPLMHVSNIDSHERVSSYDSVESNTSNHSFGNRSTDLSVTPSSSPSTFIAGPISTKPIKQPPRQPSKHSLHIDSSSRDVPSYNSQDVVNMLRQSYSTRNESSLIDNTMDFTKEFNDSKVIPLNKLKYPTEQRSLEVDAKVPESKNISVAAPTPVSVSTTASRDTRARAATPPLDTRTPPRGKEEEEEEEGVKYCRARYTFKAEGARELSFKKKDKIRIRREIDSNWMEGELNGIVGIFPSNYVDIIEDELPTPTPRPPAPHELETTFESRDPTRDTPRDPTRDQPRDPPRDPMRSMSYVPKYQRNIDSLPSGKYRKDDHKEKQRLEEERKREEERLREEQRLRKEEEEERLREEKRLEEEREKTRQRRAAEQRRAKEEEERRKAEEEARRKAEEEAAARRIAEEEEVRRKAYEEEVRRMEEEMRRMEEEERLQLEEEERVRKQEAGRKRLAEEADIRRQQMERIALEEERIRAAEERRIREEEKLWREREAAAREAAARAEEEKLWREREAAAREAAARAEEEKRKRAEEERRRQEERTQRLAEERRREEELALEEEARIREEKRRREEERLEELERLHQREMEEGRKMKEEAEERARVKEQNNINHLVSNTDNNVPDIPNSFEVKAVYSFKSSTEGELPFKKGSTITVTEVVDDNWYYGEIGERQGIFPSSYVTKIEPPSLPPPPPQTELIEECYNNESRDNGNESRDHGNESRDSYLDDSSYRSAEESDDSNFQDYELYLAQYAYAPLNSDELELERGDVIEVIERCEDGWFVGTSQRSEAFGTFPGNYVLPYEQ